MSWEPSEEDVARVAQMRKEQTEAWYKNFKGKPPTADQMRVGTKVMFEGEVWEVTKRFFGSWWDLKSPAYESRTMGITVHSLPHLQLVEEVKLISELQSHHLNGVYFEREEFFEWKITRIEDGKWLEEMVFKEFQELHRDKYFLTKEEFDEVVRILKVDSWFWRPDRGGRGI